MNLTFFHWIIYAWIVYVILGLLVAVVGYRKGLPMAYGTTFVLFLSYSIFGGAG